MANKNCTACQDLSNDAPSLILNGLSETECVSLQNDSGLNPSSGNNDCTDLNNMNDCLIGNLEPELEAYDVCDWKEFTGHFVDNSWTVFKGVICAICGLWTKFHALCQSLNRTAYVGSMTLYANTQKKGTGTGNQNPAFDTSVRQGNMPTSVLTATNGNRAITVNNTTDVPIWVDTTFNCSIDTEQNFASCFIVVTRDGSRIGQTPFITPNTYDQQVMAEPFILQPGQSTTLAYYFRVGNKNSWFQDTFGYVSGGSGEPKCVLDPNNPSDPENQRSYFAVKVQSVMPTISC